MEMVTDKNFFQQMQRYATEISGKEEISSSFPYFCLQVYFPNLVEEEIEAALNGLGSDDEGIDAFWLDSENQTVHIAQFKSVISCKKREVAKKDWFSLLADVPQKLQNENFTKKHRNARIREDIGNMFRAAMKSGYNVKLYLFHLGKATDEVLQSYPSIVYVDFDELKQQWQKYQSMTSQSLPKECELNVNYSNDSKHAHVLPYKVKYSSTEKKTYLTILTGTELINLMKKHQWELFDRNIRFYLGANNKINQKIIDSAKLTPDIFYCFNNGITLTCTRCKYKEDREKLFLEYPQVINGAQTMNSLYEAYQSLYKENLAKTGYQESKRAEAYTDHHFDKIKVLCRIVESTKGEDTEFATKLTRYNNSQNDVRVFDFFSNNPEQEEIQKKMLRFGYFYERKRGDKAYLKKSKGMIGSSGKKLSDLKYGDVKIDIRKMASVFQAYNGKPSYQECDYRNILESKTQEDYNQLFGTRADITEEKVCEMILAINIYDAVQTQVKAYTACLRVLDALRLSPHDKKLLERFKKEGAKILFFGKNMSQTIQQAESYERLQTSKVEKSLRGLQILTRGSYLLTALFHYMLVKTESHSQLMQNDLFLNRDFIQRLVNKWLKGLFEYMKKIYEENFKDASLSIESFYKRHGVYEQITDHIDREILEDDLDLKTKFPLEL